MNEEHGTGIINMWNEWMQANEDERETTEI